MIEVEGKYTTAQIMLDEVEENVIENVQAMVDNEAFRQPVRIMPDAHIGGASVIGFTMPLGTRIIPAVVGVDIGCGMHAINIGQSHRLDEKEGDDTFHSDLDAQIREAVPMGAGQYQAGGNYHIKNQFPWEEVNHIFDQFSEAFEEKYGTEIEFDGYDNQYFKDLCARVGADINDAISGICTLGGGNHFVEIARSTSTGDYWVIVHSGSRGIGKDTAEYWQNKAAEQCGLTGKDIAGKKVREIFPREYEEYAKFDLDTVSNVELMDWVHGSMGESFIKKDKVRSDFDGEMIDDVFDSLKTAIVDIGDDDPMAYLEGKGAHGYYIDMIFCQMYATVNRRMMAQAVADVLGAEQKDEIESRHNYIDFTDMIIRKGATRSHKDDRIIIPYNMKEGSIIARGEGNDEWNQSAPHGAGRVMSRGQAKRELDVDEFVDEMDGVYSESVEFSTLDEAPGAYKNVALIEEAIKPTASFVERLVPVHNLKATY